MSDESTAPVDPPKTRLRFGVGGMLLTMTALACFLTFGLFAPRTVVAMVMGLLSWGFVSVLLGGAVALQQEGRAFCLGSLVAGIGFGTRLGPGLMGFRIGAYGIDAVLGLISVACLGAIFGGIAALTTWFLNSEKMSSWKSRSE